MSGVCTRAWDELSLWHQLHFYKHTLRSPLGFLWLISTVCYFSMTLFVRNPYNEGLYFLKGFAWINPLWSKLIILKWKIYSVGLHLSPILLLQTEMTNPKRIICECSEISGFRMCNVTWSLVWFMMSGWFSPIAAKDSWWDGCGSVWKFLIKSDL